MRYFLTAFFLTFLFGCKTYKAIDPNGIKSIFILFEGKADKEMRYKLYDSSVVGFDLWHSQVKSALEKHKDRLESLKKIQSSHLDSFIINKAIIKARPIKVAPLTEFGYIQTQSGALIFYGISESVFIDLTNGKVYY